MVLQEPLALTLKLSLGMKAISSVVLEDPCLVGEQQAQNSGRFIVAGDLDLLEYRYTYYLDPDLDLDLDLDLDVLEYRY